MFIHYTISLSSFCQLIWGHWTYEMPVKYILSIVWVRLSIFSHLFVIQYMGLCVFSLPISFVMIERIYILCFIIIINLEVRSIIHCLGLGHKTMVCAVCLSIFLSLLKIDKNCFSFNILVMKCGHNLAQDATDRRSLYVYNCDLIGSFIFS